MHRGGLPDPFTAPTRFEQFVHEAVFVHVSCVTFGWFIIVGWLCMYQARSGVIVRARRSLALHQVTRHVTTGDPAGMNGIFTQLL